MGGICGFISKQNITLNDLNAMNRTLKRRGPFDSGSEIYVAHREYMAGLASNRLPIRDSSYYAHQPMRSIDGRASIVFDGELYNADSLREELKDYSFRSLSDTEVILASYLKWGISFPEHLDGMFAVAVYDADEEALYLARDPLGQKPLYYETAGTGEKPDLYFGSTLSPIMKRPDFVRVPDTDVIASFLETQYTDGISTLFRNVKKVAPGCILRFSPSSGKEPALSESRYFSSEKAALSMAEYPVTDPEEGARMLHALIRDSLRRVLQKDVPFGIMLDGDPFFLLIAKMAAKESGGLLHTYTPGLADTPYPAPEGTAAMAELLGSPHTFVRLSDKEILSVIRKLPRIFDDPVADPSLIPDTITFGMMSKDVRLALSGYTLFPWDPPSGGSVLPMAKKLTLKLRSLLVKEFSGSASSEEEGGLKGLVSGMMLSGTGKDSGRDYALFASLPERDRERKLFSSDRSAMYHSLEIRHPLIDPSVFSYLLRLLSSPDSGKRKDGHKN
ncbi:MAG: hypothetical protein K6F53_08890, partial [Lachnospiraceae bacterium]|nr:hypothetical protein [Lachnospiraceae bacterium]